jgi:hypothetical protein
MTGTSSGIVSSMKWPRPSSLWPRRRAAQHDDYRERYASRVAVPPARTYRRKRAPRCVATCCCSSKGMNGSSARHARHRRGHSDRAGLHQVHVPSAPNCTMCAVLLRMASHSHGRL